MKNLLYRARTTPVPLVLFVAFLCVFNLMAFQGPLLEYALTVSDFSKSHGYVQIASLQIVQVTLLAASLFLFATISVLAMRVFAILLNSCNAAALYFMTMFSIGPMSMTGFCPEAIRCELLITKRSGRPICRCIITALRFTKSRRSSGVWIDG